MMLLALVATAASPVQATQGWKIDRIQRQIIATRAVRGGLKIEYQVDPGTTRAIRVILPHCNAGHDFDTPKAPDDRREMVYDVLLETMREAADRCGIDQKVGDTALDGFDAAYDDIEQIATDRDTGVAPLAVKDRRRIVAGWMLADEKGEIRMRRTVGKAVLDYRVLGEVDRRLSLTVGNCGTESALVVPRERAERRAVAKAQLSRLIRTVSADCRIAPPAQTALAAGFDQAFAAIETWGRQNPVKGY